MTDEGEKQAIGATSRRERLWTPVFVVIICCSLCCFLVGQGANAGTSVYLDRTGVDTGLAGIGALVFSFAAAIARIAAGPTIDRIGRAPLMIAGAIIMLFGAIGPLAGNTGVLFIVWRTLQGLGFSIGTTAAATAAADVLPQSRLGEGIGYYGLGQALSMAVGPALAIFLIATDPPENFYLGLTVCSLGALVFAVLCTYERHPDRLPATAEYRIRFDDGDIKRQRNQSFRLWEAIFEPKALHGALPMMFLAVAYGFGIFYVGVFGTSLGVSTPGLFFTLAAVSMVVVRLVSGSFMDRVHPIVIMGVAVVSALLVYGLFLFFDAVALSPVIENLFYASGLIYGLSIGLAIPVNQTVAVRMSPSDRWGAANGLFLLANDVSIGMASLICGFSVVAFGYGPTIVGIMVMVALSFVVALKAYPKKCI